MTWIPDIREFDDEQTRIFENILEDGTNSWWIKGYAGTGKTMLLAHLANQLYKQKVSCAYVTYTHALKDLVTEGLAELTGKKRQFPFSQLTH